MEKIFNNHNQILEIIKQLIIKKCKIDLDNLKFSKITYEDDIIRFQFKCTYMYSIKGKPIYLNFEIWRDNPQILKFDTKNKGLLFFNKLDKYKGIEKAIIEEIEYQLIR